MQKQQRVHAVPIRIRFADLEVEACYVNRTVSCSHSLIHGEGFHALPANTATRKSVEQQLLLLFTEHVCKTPGCPSSGSLV